MHLRIAIPFYGKFSIILTLAYELNPKAPFDFLVFPGNNSTPDFPDNIEKFPDNTRINVRKRTNQIARFQSADTKYKLDAKVAENR